MQVLCWMRIEGSAGWNALRRQRAMGSRTVCSHSLLEASVLMPHLPSPASQTSDLGAGWIGTTEKASSPDKERDQEWVAEETGGVGGNLLNPSSTSSVVTQACGLEQPLIAELGHLVRKAVQKHKNTVSIPREYPHSFIFSFWFWLPYSIALQIIPLILCQKQLHPVSILK